ncbi:MAG: sigma factor-like helix-turn-helix DNA-binding protein [Eubacteriales bacterium]|nr:sigma factor-like helix-turn-helix DNA-binding protein [Eubacteriales bacterium]
MTFDWTDIAVIEAYASLFEHYAPLLSERQREVLTSFLLDDLSLAEIAENLQISRQAVHEHLIKGCQELDAIEAKLGWCHKWQDLRQYLNELETKYKGQVVVTDLNVLKQKLDRM